MAPGAVQVSNFFSLPSSLWVLLAFLPGCLYYFPRLTCGLVLTIISLEMIRMEKGGIDGIRNASPLKPMKCNIQHCDSGKLMTTATKGTCYGGLKFAKSGWKADSEYLWDISCVGPDTVVIYQGGYALDSDRDYGVHLWHKDLNNLNQYWKLSLKDGTEDEIFIEPLRRKGYLNANGGLGDEKQRFKFIKM